MNGMNESGHILVAEDDPTDAYFFQRAFNRAGIPVTLHFVRDGLEVVDYLRGEGQFADRAQYPIPQLLLLDLKMPRMDGFDVLGWARKQPGLSGLCIVIFSSSDEPRDMNRAYGLGANSYLVKPHSMEELTALVGRFKKYWLESSAGLRLQGRLSTIRELRELTRIISCLRRARQAAFLLAVPDSRNSRISVARLYRPEATRGAGRPAGNPVAN